MKVALTGLPMLWAYGLKAIMEEMEDPVEAEICPMDVSALQGFDCYVVSAAALASMARYLMSRLDRVLLVTTSASGHAAMPMISPLASIKEVKQALGRLLACAADTHQPADASLTEREVEVIRLTALGLTARAIADKLCISQNTVLTHRKNIAAKTGLHTVSAITHFAMVHGLMH